MFLFWKVISIQFSIFKKPRLKKEAEKLPFFDIEDKRRKIFDIIKMAAIPIISSFAWKIQGICS